MLEREADTRSVLARVVGVRGFSTLPTDTLVVIREDGTQSGEILGRPGSERLQAAARAMLAAGGDQMDTVQIEIHGKDVAEIGLACGGQADVMVQTTAAIPTRFWDLLGQRAPVALVTRVEGPQAGPASVVVEADARTSGAIHGEAPVTEAVAALRSGHTSTQRVGDFLVEAWVPDPRLVVVGTGDLVDSIRAQASLLGWEIDATSSPGDVDGLLDWAGASAAVIVLSHDPHVDTPALIAGLRRGVPYVGALGSRSTQAKRTERLLASGFTEAELATIHRPIGLDLGGRGSPEVALAIVAEILASRSGRDARSLRERTGPIH